MSPSKSICAILLAMSFLFHGAQGIVIAYRTVSPAEAAIINQSNTLYRDPSIDDDSPYYPQIGNGIYTVQEPAGWRTRGSQWYCAIEADSDKFDAVDKVWVPEYWDDPETGEEESLWSVAESEILRYIDTLVSNSEDALRFSRISGNESKLQMLLPTDVVNNNDLGFSAICFDSERQLRGYSNEVIDWRAWQIEGSP
ncbi:uncharacterized protein L3040_001681 [Drepanopeziza brunnea f. sp. 'multigermtubi']|uniref:Uncharacterized protein n=1 Tax=Marssonina brunnea f. sp. multigermtubi (strain MB_m1) TaxID=1072389 RepID=K1XRU0_MARBU|nr:uncharacterized protein MBM_06530 [Drepanopeziza brunnea f. sp. 'multigermtubi' MB_m1]EKD15314.1 hypothetical protein MBM_06530 [Drepanopeziza brunnea f. sp. 'multigermtubi' MB_m1]KAJ5051918.1 hypothetical protein L3040_001681 [Drepanopeziza brunnea f. sp. 'multigermtubi']